MTIDRQQLMGETIDVQAELLETQRALKEITMMIEQSQGEMQKLAQRNAAITAHLQQVQAKLDQTAPQEIRMAYDAALDAQQRLFVMHGQLDKLQSDRAHLEKYKNILQQSGSVPQLPAGAAAAMPGKNPMAEIEMIVNAQEAERQRLSRQMHDGPAQAMSNFILQTEIAMRLMDVDPAQAKEELGSLKNSALGTFQKVRNFIFELRPMMLDDLGLVPTIRKYVDAFKEQTGMDTALNVTGVERRIEPYLEVMIFRAIQELLGNAARHSQAASVKLHVDMGSDLVRVSVDDNGRGFDPESALTGGSLGLKLIKERAEMLGGKLDVDSSPGKGARIVFTVPVHAS
ncbi:MAG TPA: sensor histidine kinase [Anaerolineales bacterium]|nr:sensor histidine kinase [Anaerolineales bacterium]